jgi:hypothetical protein
MAQDTTDVLELQYLIKEIAREMNENLPLDLGFMLLVFHKNDGATGWATREGPDLNMDKVRSVVRDWLMRGENRIVDA